MATPQNIVPRKPYKNSFTTFLKNLKPRFQSFEKGLSKSNKQQSSNTNPKQQKDKNISQKVVQNNQKKQQGRMQNSNQQQISASAQAFTSENSGPPSIQTSTSQNLKQPATTQKSKQQQKNQLQVTTTQKSKQQQKNQLQRAITPASKQQQQKSKLQGVKKTSKQQQKNQIGQKQQKKELKLDYPINYQALEQSKEKREIDAKDMKRIKFLFNEVRINNYNPVVFVDFRFQKESIRDQAKKYLLEHGPKKLCEKIYKDNLKLFEFGHYASTLILCIGNQSYCFEIYEKDGDIVERPYSMKLFLDLILYSFELRDKGLDPKIKVQQQNGRL